MGFHSAVESPDVNPLLIWGQRFLIIVLLMLCGLILAADRLLPDRMAIIKTRATDVLAPMVDAAGVPVRWSKRQIASLQVFFNQRELAGQAEQLSAEVDRLTLELARRDGLIAELRAQINLPPEGLESFLTARVLLQGDSVFANTLVLNVGSRDSVLQFDRAFSGAFRELDPTTGAPLPFRDPCQQAINGPTPEYCRSVPVRPGLAVVTHQGILGRLQSVGYNSSRVRLITSQDSVLPVLVGSFRVRGTVSGNDTNVLTLRAEEALPGTIRIGDEVLTSNIDPSIPFLFKVGEVVALVPDIQIAPAALSSDPLEGFVQVVLKEPLDQAVPPVQADLIPVEP